MSEVKFPSLAALVGKFTGRRRHPPNSRPRSRRYRPALESLEDRSLMSVAAGTNLAGIAFPDSNGFSPPDTTVAAGPNYLVEAVNSTVAFFNKATKVKVSQQSLTTFFSPVGAGNFVFDPVVTYDELANRFVVVALDDNNGAGTSFLDFAVSNDADPTHGFGAMRRIDTHIATGSGPLLSDFDRLGWNADAYVVSMNMFHTNGTNLTTFDHVRLVTIQKSTVIGPNPTFTTFTVDRASSSGDFSLAPAVMHGAQAGGPMWFVEDGNATSVRVLRMTNVLSNTPTLTTTSVPVNAHGAPPAANQPGAGAGMIDTGDTRILNAAWRGNTLVASQNTSASVGGTTVAHARWYEFRAGTGSPTLTQQADVNPGPGVHTYYPSIEIAADGDFGLTYMESSSSEAMSMYVTGIAETPLLAHAGQATYSGATDVSGAFRAGDYSGLSVDPVAGNTFWAANEYATLPAGGNNWGTWLANFSLATPRPASNLAVINYTTTTGQVENVFRNGSDGNLYLDQLNPATFTWDWSLIANPGTSLSGSPTANNQAGDAAGQRENVFVTGADGNLYCYHYDPTRGAITSSGSWYWLRWANGLLGTNPGVALAGDPVAINYGPNTDQVESVFVTGVDGNLYVFQDNPVSGWGWQRCASSGRSFASNPAAINQAGDAAGQRENVFLTGTDGNLYCYHYDPTKGPITNLNSWYWSPSSAGTALPLGGNAPVHLASDPAAINFGPDTAQVESVFVTGSDGNLYFLQYAGGAWTWMRAVGQPTGVRLTSAPSPINQGPQGSSQRENVFVTRTDGNLYSYHFDPSRGPITNLNSWYWQGPASLQAPPVPMLNSNPAAINYGSDSWSVQRENVFVSGIDTATGHLFLFADHYDPTAGPAWYWQSFGNGGFVGNNAARASSTVGRTSLGVPATGAGHTTPGGSGGAAPASLFATAVQSPGAQPVFPTPAGADVLFAHRTHRHAGNDPLDWLADVDLDGLAVIGRE